MKKEVNMDEKDIRGTVLNVLSLEDSVRDFEIISEQLINAGFDLNISRVETQKEFTASLSGNKYDIILADFKLPGFDAFGALRIALEKCPGVPFICVSGSIGEELAVELLKSGADDYILKDRLERLPFAIKRAIDDSKEKHARSRAEKALKVNISRLELAMQSANMAWWEMDITTGNVAFHKRKTEMLGYSADKFTHYKDFMALVHPEDCEKAMDAMKRHIEGSVDKYEVEYRILTSTGEYKWFFDIGTIVERGSKGEPLFVTGLVVDITIYKQAEAAILKRIVDLEEFHKLVVGRELKMIELKKEINELAKQLGEDKERYKTSG
ncbi:MAG: PAS domain-containing protein [Bacteroidetes bacterium]|nr:PAS domain-containing protein [Bacteroidota bacterium]